MKYSYKYVKASSVLVAILLLSGCGGGGGSSASITQTTFTDWSSIVKPTQVNLEGNSTDVSYTTNVEYRINSLTSKGDDTTATASVNFRTDDTISKVQFNTQNGTVTFDEESVDTIGNSGTVVYGYNQAGSNFFLASNPLNSDNNWNYQTFGIWETGRSTGAGTAGGISAGSTTLGSSIPTSGSATYNGRFGGVMSSQTGRDYLSKGDVTVGVDFAARTLAFNTSLSQFMTPIADTPTWHYGNSFDIRPATLTYTLGTNSFTGSVYDGNTLTGTATGRFYGPNAEELGGIYYLSDSSNFGMHAGAFGAKR